MSREPKVMGATPDLDDCAREPIHVPGAVQPHGALAVLDPVELSILQKSRNLSDILGSPVASSLPRQLGALTEALRQWLPVSQATFQDSVETGGRKLIALAHRLEDGVVLEFEPALSAGEETMEKLFPRLKSFVETLGGQKEPDTVASAVAAFIRTLTRFDRVLVYRFDKNWNGHVIAEDGNGSLPSYLDLRFPSHDIPAQARELYRLNRIRIIPDAGYAPVPIEPAVNPRTGKPVDLSFAQLRSVSPVHVEYMRNMGTASSMSVSIVVGGRLWGLVACHSREPHMVSFNVRSACDFAVQGFAMQIAADEKALDASTRAGLGEIHRRLLSAMAKAADWREGLASEPEELLSQVNASGAAIVAEGKCLRMGLAPTEEQIAEIATWLETRAESERYSTPSLARDMPDGGRFAATASGLLAIRISELHPNWVLWFRPEVVSTVKWGGDPHKSVSEQGRIHPRHSFDAWKEQVHFQAGDWSDAELAAASDLRNSIVGIVMRKAEELAQLTQELQSSNKELEAFSYSVSHDLRAPFRHIVGYSQLLRDREKALDEKSLHYVSSIAESAVAAGRLVDDLLNFSHLGRASLSRGNINMNKMVKEVQLSLALSTADREVEWHIGNLPNGWGDATLIRQVWYNLIENAVKYTRDRRPAVISIEGSRQEEGNHYVVRDNGVGFDMNYVDKLFGVFQRLQRAEDFEGTGIGLALVKRILDRHHGKIWAEGEVDRGATLHFLLPPRERTARA